MKKQILTLMLSGGLLCYSMMGNSSVIAQIKQSVAQKSDKIDLKGDLPTTGIRSVGERETVTAFVQTETISAYFALNIGNVTVSITNKNGDTVFNTVIDSRAGHIIIPISMLTEGNYTILFDNGYGTLWGDFSL